MNKFLWHRTALSLATFALLVIPCPAASTLFKAARVHTVSGPVLEPGAVLVADGKIVEVAQRITRAADQTLDLGALQLFPGLIAADTQLGLTEISSVRGSVDRIETGEFTPDVFSWIAVNPDSELIPVARANGIAYAHVVPGGGMVPGHSAVMALDGWTWEEMSVRRPTALHVRWPSMALNTSTGVAPKAKALPEQDRERQKRVREIEEFFHEAKAYAKAKAAEPKLATVPAWEAMLPAARGEIPVVVEANEVRQIRSAIEWAKRNDIRMILSGGRDAWMVAALLAERKIPVIYSGIWALPPRDHDSYDVQFRAPSVMAKAGVALAIMQGGARMEDEAWTLRNLPHAAAQAAAYGLDPAQALRAITLSPAEILGVAERIGSIEKGKDATFIAVNGSILDVRVKPQRMWIGGREVSLESRHTRLYDKFKARPQP